MADELKLEGGVVVLHIGDLKPTSSDLDFLYYSVGIILFDANVHSEKSFVDFSSQSFWCKNTDLIPLVKISGREIADQFIDNLRTHKDKILAGALRAIFRLKNEAEHIRQVNLEVDLADARMR